jgi:hypothetical protein
MNYRLGDNLQKKLVKKMRHHKKPEHAKNKQIMVRLIRTTSFMKRDIDRSLLTTVENFGRTDRKKYGSNLTVRKVSTISTTDN